ncbi:MAG TPA: tetratricopeptide repeat protein [Gemmatimonadaceae bacterium]|nr:tetratricopeptide repeat protein [Gemmatimonadaceae bacterium]
MGMISVAENKSGDAVEWFEKAIKANDRSSIHHLWLGNALGEQADHTNKIKLPFLARRVKGEFDKAVELDPSSVDARHGLIQFYSQAPGVMGGSMDKAKEQAREIGKLSPWRGHYETAQLLEREKDSAGAEREYTAAVAAAPDSNATYLYLASFLRRQKRYDEALTAYENLLKRRPDANNAHLNIGLTLNQANKDPERVERETRLWMANAPADAAKVNLSIAHYLLGQSAERQTRKDVAKGEYQQALTLNPKNNEAKKALDELRP